MKTAIEWMALEAGAVATHQFTEVSLEYFVKLVRADENEACARMVDHILKQGGGTYGDAIRARRNK